MDHRSFRDQLASSIGYAITRSRDLLGRLLKEHAPDDARQMLAQRVVQHLEQSGFEIDEQHQVLRRAAAEREPRLERFGRFAFSTSSRRSADLAR